LKTDTATKNDTSYYKHRYELLRIIRTIVYLNIISKRSENESIKKQRSSQRIPLSKNWVNFRGEKKNNLLNCETGGSSDQNCETGGSNDQANDFHDLRNRIFCSGAQISQADVS
jgi:hypothetical protein